MVDIDNPIEAVNANGRVSGVAIEAITRTGKRFDVDAIVANDGYRSVWNETGKDQRPDSNWSIRNIA